ncbi:hypothetical protein CBM2621_B190127 [Cupriavidus taiwanensis]|nr:hypothetical protein CBM2621_B190127 [Cupriavidus taiwanensis]
MYPTLLPVPSHALHYAPAPTHGWWENTGHHFDPACAGPTRGHAQARRFPFDGPCPS